jgi:hypothetical protein
MPFKAGSTVPISQFNPVKLRGQWQVCPDIWSSVHIAPCIHGWLWHSISEK